MTLVQCDSEDWQGGGAAVGSPRGLGVLLQDPERLGGAAAGSP